MEPLDKGASQVRKGACLYTGKRVSVEKSVSCRYCHFAEGFEFEQPETLYMDSVGHGGVHCAACHGSPHAIIPTVTSEDNLQAIEVQGRPGVVGECLVCHKTTPPQAFEHKFISEP